MIHDWKTMRSISCIVVARPLELRTGDLGLGDGVENEWKMS